MPLKKKKIVDREEEKKNVWPTAQVWLEKCLLSYLFHTCNDRRFDIHSIDEWKGTMAKSDRLLFNTELKCPPTVCSRTAGGAVLKEQGVTSRLFPRPFKQSRPMTCITVPFEEEASSFIVKEKSRRTPITKGSSSWLQRGKQGQAKKKKKRHLLPWLQADYENLAFHGDPFSCSLADLCHALEAELKSA